MRLGKISFKVPVPISVVPLATLPAQLHGFVLQIMSPWQGMAALITLGAQHRAAPGPEAQDWLSHPLG